MSGDKQQEQDRWANSFEEKKTQKNQLFQLHGASSE